MKLFKNRMLAVVLTVAMAMTCLMGISAFSFAEGEGDTPQFVVKEYAYDTVNAEYVECDTIKTYSNEELMALSKDYSDSPLLYPYVKSGIRVNQLIKGIPYADLLADAGVSAADYDKIGQLATARDGSVELYSKSFAKSDAYDFITQTGYSYVKTTPDGVVEEGAVEVPAVIATEYKYKESAEAGVAVDQVDFTGVESTIGAISAEGKSTIYSFIGSKDASDVAGNKFCREVLGVYLVRNCDKSIEIGGQTVYYNSNDESVQLPATYGDKNITGWSYLKDNAVIDLGMNPSAEDLTAAAGENIIPTPKTVDDVFTAPVVDITSVTSAKKAITVNYQVTGNTVGVEVAYQKSGSKSWKTKKTTNKTSLKIKSLSKKKYYNVKVRTYYYTPEQVLSYGEWTDVVKSPKTK